MHSRSQASCRVQADVARGGALVSSSVIRGWFHMECLDKDGNFRWELGSKEYDPDNHNLWTTEGMNALLDQMKSSGSPTITPVYVGIALSTPTWSASNASSFQVPTAPGWTEWTDYTGNRPAWLASESAATGAITNSTPISFVANGSATVNGAFTVGANATKSNVTSGYLLSEQKFTQLDRSLNASDELRVTYTMSLTST